MSARKGFISRVSPNQQIDRVVVAAEPGSSQRPVMGALQVVWRGRYILLTCVLFSLIAGYIRMVRAVPVYRSSSILLLQQSNPIISVEGLQANTQSSGYLYTQCEIIHSTAILTKALTQPGVSESKSLKGLDPVAAVGFLKNAVIAGTDPQGDLITVGMDSTDPKDAATIVNGVVSAYISYESEQHHSNSVEVLKILASQIDKQNQELKAQQQALTNFKRLHPELALESDRAKGAPVPFSGELSVARMHSVNFKMAVDEANHFRDDAYMLKRILDRANADTGTPAVTDPIIDPVQLQTLASLEQDLESRDPDTTKNPAVIKEQAALAALRREVALERAESAQKYLSLLSEESDAAKQRENTLRAEVDRERSKLIDINSKEDEYDQLVTQTQETSRTLEGLNTRMKTLNVNGDVGGMTAAVLEPAKPSYDSVGKGKTYIMGMALVIGLMSGLGGSALLEMVDQRFRSVEEISRTLSLPILGAVPRIQPGSQRRIRTSWTNYLRRRAEMIGRKRWKNAQTMMECGQIMHLHPRSDVAEAYRSIRTGIYFGLSGHPAKAILITSPTSGDGKTTLASNLAICIAQAGRRVLLIDADCWRPSVDKIFDLSGDAGLTTVLMKKSALTESIRKTQIENLDILPCGEIPPNPAELLESQALLDLLAEAGELYDQILIDSPPIVPITDARILAASCGATILVLRAGKSTRNQADEAFEALSGVGAPILGVVVNDAVRPARGKASTQYNAYAGPRESKPWTGFDPALNGNANGHAQINGNGHSKQLNGPVVEVEEPIDGQEA